MHSRVFMALLLDDGYIEECSQHERVHIYVLVRPGRSTHLSMASRASFSFKGRCTNGP